jgi:hypothetical protein
MAKKLIVLAHGIGDTSKDFYKEWEEVLKTNHTLDNAVVKGLWWEDILDEVEKKYPLVDTQFAAILDMCGFSELKKFAGKDQAKVFQDYIMDVLVYVGLQDMWLLIQSKCIKKLEELRKDSTGTVVFAESDLILIGHSLGAAMLPQLTWYKYVTTGLIPYRGMILLASPLGFESPMPKLCQDFLQRMGTQFGGERRAVLDGFSKAWRSVGKNRLKFVCNEKDIVCSDVKYEIPVTGKLVDIIPLRQGFNPAEIALVNSQNQQCIEFVSFGEAKPSEITANHDVLKYLNQQAFITALDKLL